MRCRDEGAFGGRRTPGGAFVKHEREVTDDGNRDQSHKYLRARACDRGCSYESFFFSRVIVILQLQLEERRRSEENKTTRHVS